MLRTMFQHYIGLRSVTLYWSLIRDRHQNRLLILNEVQWTNYYWTNNFYSPKNNHQKVYYIHTCLHSLHISCKIWQYQLQNILEKETEDLFSRLIENLEKNYKNAISKKHPQKIPAKCIHLLVSSSVNQSCLWLERQKHFENGTP